MMPGDELGVTRNGPVMAMVSRASFLGDLHGSDFGGKAEPERPITNDAVIRGPRFTRHGDGNAGYVADGAEAAKFVSSLESKIGPQKKSDRERIEGRGPNIEACETAR